MKNIKKMFQTGFLTLVLLFFAQSGKAQTISSQFFGQNAWMPDTIGNANACADPPCILYGKLHQQWENIKDSKASIIRFGGISPDRNMPTNYQYIKMIDSIRAKGMEPVIQVPFFKYKYSAQQAADIVSYLNVTKGKNIKYWIIGNEPDLDYAYTSAAQVAAYFKPFASAMKSVDPNILIIGPECAWFNQAIINGLTTPNGPDDITGKDAAGRFYLDIISFHTYPFDGTQTRAQVISKLTAVGQLQDNLVYLNNRIAACNTAHGRTGSTVLKTAITEANINYKNSTTDNLQGVGVNSFIGGQFIAEMMGIGMKEGVSFMNIWSVVEGNNMALNIGYIDAATGIKKPAYYHFKMLAENFRGNYVNGITNQLTVKSFGSQTTQNTTVLVMNQDLVNNYNFTVRLNVTAITGNSALKINISAGIANEYSGVIPSQSTMLLTFNTAGILIKKTEYSLMSNAMANLPPTVTDFGTGIATSTNGSSDGEAISMKGFGIKVFPNPANSKFTIQIDRPNPQDIKFGIELFDMVGRLVYTKESTFSGRKQEIDVSSINVADAIYVLRVYEGEDKDNVKTDKIAIFK